MARDLALQERAGEGGVERLHDACAWRGRRRLLRARTGFGGDRLEGVDVERVGDVDHDLAVELGAVAAQHIGDDRVPDSKHDDVAGEGIADGARPRLAWQFAGERLGLLLRRAEQRDAVTAGEEAGGDATGHVAGADDGDVHVVLLGVCRSGPAGSRSTMRTLTAGDRWTDD